MKCLVIGGKGYLGKNLAYYLKGRNCDVRIYDVVPSEEKNYMCVDMTNPESVSTIDLNVDYIYMFAGLTRTYAGFDAYEKYIKNNEIALLNLLNAIRLSEYRPKIIFPSSRLVYKGYDKPLKEDAEKEAKTIYAANKIACEGFLQAYCNSFDIPYTVFRICVPYGALQSSNNTFFGTVGFFLKQASAGKEVSLYGGGTIKRTFTFMEDVCYQIVEGAMKKESDGQIYNVGGETLSLRQVAEIIANKFRTKVVDVPWPDKDLRIESGHTFFDDTKIQDLLGGMTYKRLEDFMKYV